jgi:GNAT superfamily N-acetyltransferase
METIIRQASTADKDAIWNFIKVAYGDFSKHMIPKRWTWQYSENPYVDKKKNVFPILLAIKDDQIVGQACVTPVELKVGDEIYIATWGTDFIVLPTCRGEGVGKKLMDVELDHYKFMIGLWMPYVTRRIAKQLGYKTLDPVIVYWRPVRLHKFFINNYLMPNKEKRPLSHRLFNIACRYFFLDRLISIMMNIIWGVRDLVEKNTKKNTLCDIQEVDDFDQRIDNLWNSTSNQYKIIVKRDREFLNWRYSRHHVLTYKKFIAQRDGETKGYLVLRKAEPEELNLGRIVDLYAKRNDHQTIEDLIRHAIRFFKNDVDIIECATSVKEYQHVLSKFGFFKVETSIPMYRCEDSSLAYNLNNYRSNCFFTLGDHDWDQYQPVQGE